MKISIEDLKSTAAELNDVLSPEPPIKIKNKSTVQELTSEIKATAELLEDGDTISQKTYNTLNEMEIDMPGKIKVKEANKVEKKTEETKKNTKKEIVEKKGNSLKEAFDVMLKESKYTQKEIKENLLKKFPDKSPNTITTLLSDSKNEKWQPMAKLVVVDKNGIMKYKK